MNEAMAGASDGRHRVLEPAGAEPLTATRLDALTELWDGELRIDLEALVLERADLASWRAAHAGDATAMTASLLEAVAERGGLDGPPGRGTYVGRIAARGGGVAAAELGERIAVPVAARALPAFVLPAVQGPVPDAGLDAGPDTGPVVVPVRGHAIVPSGVTTVPVGAAPPALAALLARVAAVPGALTAASADVQRWVVLGAGTPAGATAVAALASAGHRVTALTGTLPEADALRSIGASEVVVGDPQEVLPTARLLAGGAPFDAVVLADALGSALAPRLARLVLAVDTSGDLATVHEHASAAGLPLDLRIVHEPGRERGAALRQLVASSGPLRDLLRWHAGLVADPRGERDHEGRLGPEGP